MSDAWRYAVWPIQDQDQGHEPLNVVNPAIFKSYLPRHLQWELATYHGFLKDTISQFDHMGLIYFESILTCYDVSELVNSRLLLCSFSVLWPYSIWGLATPWTYFLHLSLSSVILTFVILMLSIQAVRGLSRLHYTTRIWRWTAIFTMRTP